jgi:HD-like signal output (HDOD) protein
VRVLLTDGRISEQSLRGLRIAHRALPEGSDPGLLVESIGRTLTMSQLVSQPEMRTLLGRVGNLPVAPRVFAELTHRLEDPSVSVEQLAELVGEDAGLTVQVLRLANSAYFGRDQNVGSLSAAAARLGTRVLRSLVLAAEVFDRFHLSDSPLSLDEQQRHASLVARIASSLEPRAPWKEDAFTAGLLHDVGKLLLAARAPALYTPVLQATQASGRPLHEVEREMLGVDHGALGACLLGTWGLPGTILEAVHRHHLEHFAGPVTLDVVQAVAIADRLAHAVMQDGGGGRGSLVAVADPRWEWWCDLAQQLADESAVA